MVEIPKEQIAEFCRRHHIHRLSLFGSVLRDDFRPDSDVDVLVEFEPGYKVGWDIIDIEEEFSRFFERRRVEMINPNYLNRHLRERILASAQLQYEASNA
jgi:uncharacterized protein